MLATLRVREVGAIVLVHRQTQATFKAADMVFEEVWVLVCAEMAVIRYGPDVERV